MTKQTLSFQAEVKQILHLVTHSLYSNKEIFLRELISNASDACDKLRFEALNNAALYENAPTLEVRVSFDAPARKITIHDNGIGLSQDEAIANLGTIAKSGTREFMAALEGDQKKDAQLIGQFGVGFYSGFIVADSITVESRRAGLSADEGVRWSSKGDGDFEVESINRAQRGTSVTLHMRAEEDEFLSGWKLKSIIGKYSDHISLPILMQKEEWDTEAKKQVLRDEWAAVNKAAALWTRMPKDFVTLADWSADELQELLARASELKQRLKRGERPQTLEGRSLAMFFEKPSLRTHVTFEAGISQLGGHAILLRPEQIGIGTRESPADVARNLSRWVDGIVARTFRHKVVEDLLARFEQGLA